MLTGREVRGSQGWDNGSILPPNLPTIPGVFSSAGYSSCLVGKMHLSGDRQFAGFDHRPYGDLTGGTGHQQEPLFDSLAIQKGLGKDYSERVSGTEYRHTRITEAGVTEFPESLLQEQNVTKESISFLREQEHQNPDQPWLLCASFSRPHAPYTAPRRHFDKYWPDGVTKPEVVEGNDFPYESQVSNWFDMNELDGDDILKARAAYFACIDYLDEIIGDFLTTLDRSGLLEDTIIVYLSDHGDMIGEHNMWGKRTWNEESSRVPWIVECPGHRSGELPSNDVSTPVSLSDLFPTLCSLANINQPKGLDGTDLLTSVTRGKEPDRDPVMCDLLSPQFGENLKYRVIRDGQYKYVGFQNARELLFDIESDQYEENNLAENPDDETKQVLEEFRQILNNTMDFESSKKERKEAKRLKYKHKLILPSGHGNVYHMPDGRLVDADTPLYQPNVISENASAFFDDR